MKRLIQQYWLILAFFVFAMYAAAQVTGCANPFGGTTPAVFDSTRPIQDRVASGEKIYAATLRELTVLRKGGVITDDEQRQIAQLRIKADTAFDAADMAFRDGNNADANAQLTLIQNLLNELTTKLYAAQLKKDHK